jgi:hypothetical protein
MNDKLFVFRSIFYGAVPQYQRVFLEKKRKALEDRLKEEKALFEQEMNAMSSKAKRRMRKHPEMRGGAKATAPNKHQDFKGRNRSGLNELLGLPSLGQPRGSGLTAQQMIENLRIRKKIAPVEPPAGLNVKSRYRSTLNAQPAPKRANSTTDATQFSRRGSLAPSDHSRPLAVDQPSNSGAESGKRSTKQSFGSRPSPLAVNAKAEKPSFDVAADHRIKEADEQDETMTPVPKRYANRLEAKQAYAAKREEQGKLAKLQQPRSESSHERSLTLAGGGCGDSQVGVAAAEEELRAEDASVLHSSAPGLQPAIILCNALNKTKSRETSIEEASNDESEETKSAQMQKVLAVGPLPETDRGPSGNTRTLSLGSIEKKLPNSNRKLLGSFDASRAPEHDLSASLRQAHQNPPKMAGVLADTKSR